MGLEPSGRWINGGEGIRAPPIGKHRPHRRRASFRRAWMLLSTLVITVGAALGYSWITGYFGDVQVAASNNTTLLSCGFEKGPDYNQVVSGSGVPAGSQYIHSTSTLPAYQTNNATASTDVNPTASMTVYAFGAGSGTEEYLVGEVSFFCVALPSGTTTVTFSVSDSYGGSPGTNSAVTPAPSYAVVFLQTGTPTATYGNNPYGTTTCEGSSPNILYEPQGGGTMWAWDATTSNLWTGGGCSFASGPVSEPVTTASTTAPVWTLSFGFVGMPFTTCFTSCPTYTTYTLSFQAANP